MADRSNIIAQRTFLGLGPGELPMVAYVQAVMENSGPFNFDLIHQSEEKSFTTVQAVFIDNSQNAGLFTLRANHVGPGFPVYCNAFSVGMFPLAALSKLSFTATHALANANVDMWLLNVPQPYFQYQVTQ